MLTPWKKSYDKPRQHIKENRDKTLPTNVCIVKAMIFPVIMYGCEFDYKRDWATKIWCFQTAVLEKTVESPLDCKEIKPVDSKGNQPWVSIGRIHAELEASVLCLPDVQSHLIGKDPDAGKDWGQEEKEWQRTSKASILWQFAFFLVQISQAYVTNEKTTDLTIWNFFGRVMSLLFNTLSRFVIALLKRSNLLISHLQSPATVILELN